MMGDPIPLALAAPVAAGLVAAVAALWHRIEAVERHERRACDERLEGVERRVQKLEGERDSWQDRWVREVQRGVTLAALPAAPGPPHRPPLPSWDEPTGVRSVRAVVEAAAHDEALRRYIADSTPPKGTRS